LKYLKKYELFEKKEENKFTGENRIILLGPPTVGKSTISKALGEKLDLEVISLDMNQMKFGGFGEKEEVECVKWALSNKVNKPSILDFGGGHIYRGNAKDLIKEYNNVFVLIPSDDYELSDEILRKNSRISDMRKMIDHILKSIESPSCEFSDDKKEKVIKIVKKIHSGDAGKLEKRDIPKASLNKFGDSLKGGFDSAPNWDKYSSLYTKKHDKINRSITDNLIEVFTEEGNRRSVSSIVNEIIKKCKY
jgi:shikimate kinase